jgi:hypothetical protein
MWNPETFKYPSTIASTLITDLSYNVRLEEAVKWGLANLKECFLTSEGITGSRRRVFSRESYVRVYISYCITK